MREDLLARAAESKRSGDLAGARKLLRRVLASDPADAAALNALGLVAMEERDFAAAASLFTQATEADPKAIRLWWNLCEANLAAGDARSALKALNGALGADAYCVPALLRKGQILEKLGDLKAGIEAYKGALFIASDRSQFPPAIQSALAHGESLVRAEATRIAGNMREAVEEVLRAFPGSDPERARIFADNLAGARKIYQPQPFGGHFPYLPAYEFFDRSHFPWFEELEAATETIREELLALWRAEEKGFRPYIASDASDPHNRMVELNKSMRWNVWFFREDGARKDENCARCPQTAALLERLPLFDAPGRGPTTMFSILEPRTRIPAHTGVTNIRSVVHLPLVLPEGCGFRVGGESRQWRLGEAWAFDDTIEHEAWNDSDEVRAILIVDAWNPLISEPEREAVRELFARFASA